MANRKTILIKADGAVSTYVVRDVIQVGDVDAYDLVIVLGQAVTGTAVLRMVKPDGTWYDVDADVDGKTVLYTMAETDYDTAGLLDCYVRLFDGEGGIYTPLLIRFTGVRGIQDGE